MSTKCPVTFIRCDDKIIEVINLEIKVELLIPDTDGESKVYRAFCSGPETYIINYNNEDWVGDDVIYNGTKLSDNMDLITTDSIHEVKMIIESYSNMVTVPLKEYSIEQEAYLTLIMGSLEVTFLSTEELADKDSKKKSFVFDNFFTRSIATIKAKCVAAKLLRDAKKEAKDIIAEVGGLDNIISVDVNGTLLVVVFANKALITDKLYVVSGNQSPFTIESDAYIVSGLIMVAMQNHLDSNSDK